MEKKDRTKTRADRELSMLSFPRCNQAGEEFVISINENLQEKVMFLTERFPVSMYTQNYIHAASDQTPFHWHEELQITWVFDGALRYSVNGSTFALDSSRILLINRRQLHSAGTFQKDASTLCINFSPELFHPFLQEKIIRPLLQNPAFSYMLLPLSPYSTELLRKFLCWNEESVGFFPVMNFLSQTMDEAANNFKEGAGNIDYEEIRLFHSALSYIHNNYMKPLTIRDLADHTLICKNRLTSLFKKYTNMPPIRYLNEYRLYNAKNMILHSDKSVSEISADVGFNQVSHFIAQFRKSYGLSPLKYRNKYLSHRHIQYKHQ